MTVIVDRIVNLLKWPTGLLSLGLLPGVVLGVYEVLGRVLHNPQKTVRHPQWNRTGPFSSLGKSALVDILLPIHPDLPGPGWMALQEP